MEDLDHQEATEREQSELIKAEAALKQREMDFKKRERDIAQLRAIRTEAARVDRLNRQRVRDERQARAQEAADEEARIKAIQAARANAQVETQRKERLQQLTLSQSMKSPSPSVPRVATKQPAQSWRYETPPELNARMREAYGYFQQTGGKRKPGQCTINKAQRIDKATGQFLDIPNAHKAAQPKPTEPIKQDHSDYAGEFSRLINNINHHPNPQT